MEKDVEQAEVPNLEVISGGTKNRFTYRDTKRAIPKRTAQSLLLKKKQRATVITVATVDVLTS